MSNMIVCNHCDGKGFIIKPQHKTVTYCNKCKGFGTVTWLENIFGKEKSVIVRFHRQDGSFFDFDTVHGVEKRYE